MGAVTAGEDRVRLLYRMRARRLFWRMLERQGLDPAQGWWHGLDVMIGRAVARCGECRHGHACRAWLDRPSSGSVPAFCANADAMAAARIAGSTAQHASTHELGLRELLEDPIVRRLMTADRVNGEILRQALTGPRHFTAAYAAPQQVPVRRRSVK